MVLSVSDSPLTAPARQVLDRILSSRQFLNAPRQAAFLRFVVEESLAGRGNDLKETLIATQVYEKAADYDPRIDSTVRVEAIKLRQRLAAYYEGPGANDPFRLSIPKGSYRVVIEPAEPTVETNDPSQRFQLPVQAWALAIPVLAAVWHFLPAGKPPVDAAPILRDVQRLTALGSYATGAAISKDGSFAVYATDRDSGGVLNLWRHPLDGGAPVRLTRSGVNHREPAISPDGKQIVFRADSDGGVLYVMPAAGGEPRRIPESAGAHDPRLGGRDSRSVLYWTPRDRETPDYGRVYLASTEPQAPWPVLLFGDFAHASRPIWSGDGRLVLALGTWHSNIPDKEFDAWVVDLDGRYARGAPVKTGLFPLLRAKGLYRTIRERSGIEVSDWRDEWLYFTAPSGESRDLFRVRLPAAGRVEGDPQRMTFGAGSISGISLAGDGSTLVFLRPESSYNLHSVQVSAPGEPAGEPFRHTIETGVNFRVAVAPTGNSAVWERQQPGAGNQVWHLGLATGVRRNLKGGSPAVRSHAILSPSGDTVAYRVADPDFQPIYAQAPDGTERRICDNCGTPADWTADGRHILYITGGTPSVIGLLHASTGAHGDLISHPNYNLNGARARVNANGDGWVAFYVDNSPRSRQILLARLNKWRPAEPRDWVPVTDGTEWDQSPAWSPDGRTLYFTNWHDGFRCIMARGVDPATGRPSGPAWAVRHFHGPSQTLMLSLSLRGVDALWAAKDRLYFMLDDRRSDLWLGSIR
ncbi:MAG: hypothetical protein SFV51_04905 [Bryobacteraceae bacterium]|nr:hypothetical protein [Bryobacteraceae bacterium]